MKASILVHSPAVRAVLPGILEEADVECRMVEGQLEQFTHTGEPLELLIAESQGTRGDLAVLERLTDRHPRLAVVLIAANPGREFLLDAMRLGVREVLDLPLQPDVVRDVVRRLRQRLGTDKSTLGKVIVFQPSKGGSGATFLAANFGYALALTGRRVGLIDLNLQFGDAALHVCDASGDMSVAELAQQIARLDGKFLQSSMLQAAPNYGVLPAPKSPDSAVGVRPEAIQRLLEVAREEFDYVIFDVERSLCPLSLRVLDNADHIMLVLQLTLPFIRDAKRVISVFDSLGYSRDKLRLIVNRYQKGGEISLGDVEATLGLPVHYTVPNSFVNVAASVNQGRPIQSLDPTDRVSRSLADMAAHLSESVSTAPSGKWFSRLFGRTN